MTPLWLFCTLQKGIFFLTAAIYFEGLLTLYKATPATASKQCPTLQTFGFVLFFRIMKGFALTIVIFLEGVFSNIILKPTYVFSPVKNT